VLRLLCSLCETLNHVLGCLLPPISQSRFVLHWWEASRTAIYVAFLVPVQQFVDVVEQSEVPEELFQGTIFGAFLICIPWWAADVQDGQQNYPVFDLLIKSFFQLTILETNIQKERPLHGDVSSVNQVFNMTTVMSTKFFNMNCDVVDY
jgi:hypothetical protein